MGLGEQGKPQFCVGMDSNLSDGSEDPHLLTRLWCYMNPHYIYHLFTWLYIYMNKNLIHVINSLDICTRSKIMCQPDLLINSFIISGSGW
jgi:hypothetical protein